MDKDKYAWEWINEKLHKKIETQMDEIKKLHKENETIFDLARKYPEKTYRELEKYRDADRQEESQNIPLTESQKFQAELEPLTDSQKDLIQTVESAIEKNKKGTCITGAMRKDRQEMNPKIKHLEEVLANALEISEAHQKLNGKLQERLTELEEENKKLNDYLHKRIQGSRESGM